MDIYLKLFEVLFPVFFIVGIGFLLGKKNPNFDTSFITTYAGNFGTPALVIFALTAGGVTFDIFKEFFFYALMTNHVQVLMFHLVNYHLLPKHQNLLVKKL